MLLLLLLVIQAAISCGGGGGGGGGSSAGPTGSGLPSGAAILPPVVGSNVVPITVNGSLCSNSAFINKVCVSVTICTPGTAICQTVNDIILDTASYGLRIFRQVLGPVTPTQVTVPAGAVAECIQFGGGSSDWGPVQIAGVILGNEPAVQVPIQVIDSTFGTRPAGCANADAAPASAGFNGILGAGLFIPDCGTGCADSSANGIYYSCTGAGCTGAAVPVGSQVQNPVAALPVDNNGVIVQLPAVLPGGAPSANGFLILGIGTQANNTPGLATTYPANPVNGQFFTVFNGSTLNGLLDTGTSMFLFPSGGTLPNCPAPNSSWYCPATLTDLSATNEGYPVGFPVGVVPFQIGNFNSLAASSNLVFPDIGANGTTTFIWGLPFFLGRTVYVGIQGRASTLGTGPYWAY